MLHIHVFMDDHDLATSSALSAASSELTFRGEWDYELHFYRPGRSKPEWGKIVELYGIQQLPTVIYCMDSEERVRLTGAYATATYLWQALSILEPFNFAPRRRRKTHRPKEWELLNASQKKR